MDPIDLLKRLQSVPLGPLLESLREIHRFRTQEPEWIPAAQPELWRALVPGGSETRAEVGVSRAVTVPPLQAPPQHQAPVRDDVDPGSSSYDAVRELFGQRESALSRQSHLVDRVLDQLRSGRDVSSVSAASPLQQEIRLACPVRGRTAGRFIVASEAGAELLLHLQLSEPVAARDDAGPVVSLDPPELVLGAGEERVVKVEVDLSGSSAVSGDRFELPVEAVDAGGNVLVKAWVELLVVDLPAAEVP